MPPKHRPLRFRKLSEIRKDWRDLGIDCNRSTRAWLLLTMLLCFSTLTEEIPAEERQECVRESDHCDASVNESSADWLYWASLRLEELGFQEEAFKSMAAASALDPSRTSLVMSLKRLSMKGIPALQKEGFITVQSVSSGLCEDIKDAWGTDPVRVQTFTRDDPHTVRADILSVDDVDDTAFFACSKWPNASDLPWRSLQISIAMPGQGPVEDQYSFIEADDPFIYVQNFMDKHSIKHDDTFEALYNVIARHRAALRNETLNPAPPPYAPPAALLDTFTMGGRIKMYIHYKDDFYETFKQTKWSRREIDEFVEHANKRGRKYYGATDEYLYGAMDAFSGGMKDKNVVIMGSASPWYEAICISREAASCTTIEYNVVEYEHPLINTYTVEEYERASPRPRFHVGISISSFEHDGLGRYGDPIDPNGDIRAMNDMRSVIREDGLLFLSVPVTMDRIYWNVHRIYGRIRLPLLIQNWTLVGHCGLEFGEILGYDDGRGEVAYQPILILRNRIPARADAVDESFDWDSFVKSKSCRQ